MAPEEKFCSSVLLFLVECSLVPRPGEEEPVDEAAFTLTLHVLLTLIQISGAVYFSWNTLITAGDSVGMLGYSICCPSPDHYICKMVVLLFICTCALQLVGVTDGVIVVFLSSDCHFYQLF